MSEESVRITRESKLVFICSVHQIYFYLKPPNNYKLKRIKFLFLSKPYTGSHLHEAFD